MYKEKWIAYVQSTSRKILFYIVIILLLFALIGFSTALSPTYRLSSDMIQRLTSNISSETFLYLFTLDIKPYQNAFTEDLSEPKLTDTLIHLATNIKPEEIESLLGQELPGFSRFNSKFIVKGDETDLTTLAIESSPPLDDVLKDRPAEDLPTEKEESEDLTTGNREVVFVYSTHNRESFLPHLPESTSPNEAHHKEVNITKVSKRFKKSLNNKGIGTSFDATDFMNILKKKNWDYNRSYDASRDVVEETLASNKDLKYVFDIHRDSLPRDKTTKEINDKVYAKILFVIGADHPNYEKNLRLAIDLEEKLEEKYPGISRGVVQKAGPGTNGIFNQDLLENSVLVEVGGYENKLEEMYLSIDALAEVFSDYYWQAEKVSNKQKGGGN